MAPAGAFIYGNELRRVMLKTWIPVIPIIGALAACSPARDGSLADEYAVWSAAIETQVAREYPAVVVADSTYSLETASPVTERLMRAQRREDGLSREIVEDFIIHNRRRVAVDAGRLAVRKVRLLRAPAGAAGEARHAAVRERLLLSRAGFDRGGRRALVTVTVNCGGLCGGGATLLMERQPDGRWRKARVVSDIIF